MSYLIKLLSINIGRKMGNHTSQDMNGNIRMSPGSKWNVMQRKSGTYTGLFYMSVPLSLVQLSFPFSL